MAITTEGMKVIASEDTGYNLRTIYRYYCGGTNHSINYYEAISTRESKDGIAMTKATWSCGCSLVDRLEPSPQRVSA